MKTFNLVAAQGDLMIVRINELPKESKPVKAEKGFYIVAHSETGHNHVIAERPNVTLYTTDNPMVSYLEVVEVGDKVDALIEHLRSFDTHETIKIPAGTYEIRRQREYTPEGWRRVED
jgi:hypothetical protein